MIVSPNRKIKASVIIFFLAGKEEIITLINYRPLSSSRFIYIYIHFKNNILTLFSLKIKNNL